MIMMKKTVPLLLILFCLNLPGALAQEKTPGEKKFGITFSGFVKNDFFFDSRQTVSAREGHFLLWPSAVKEDAMGNDIHARSNFNFLAVQSRLTGKITGPDALGAKTSGVIEGDFFAQSDTNINLFRLRHAFISLEWEKTRLLTGQYWNPLFVTGCFPGTVSFNTGTPLQSFARNPQIRVTRTQGNFRFLAAALAQRDYTSRGPDPADNQLTSVSSEYLRNAFLPDMHLQVHYSQQDTENGTAFLAGIGGAYKTIVPRLSSSMGDDTYKVNEYVSGVTAIAFSRITLPAVTIKVQGRYGENIADVLSISGFAMKETINGITGERSYTPLQNVTAWGEIHTNHERWQVGLFGGYMENLGTKESMSDPDNPVYGLATNIASLYRVSPRVIYRSGKFKAAAELEYTVAAYGSDYDSSYTPGETESTANTRILLSTIYNF